MFDKECAYQLYQNGKSVKYIAAFMMKSKSTIYRWISEIKDVKEFPIIKKQIKKVLLQGNFKSFVTALSYSDLCMIRRNIGLYGSNKKSIQNSILEYFRSYSILGLYPEGLNRSIVKRAYYKKARETHPDMTKMDSATAFMAVDLAYREVMSEVE